MACVYFRLVQQISQQFTFTWNEERTFDMFNPRKVLFMTDKLPLFSAGITHITFGDYFDLPVSWR